MRIISGKYKGRNIKGYDIDGTRPTMDRVKESLFGSIQNYIQNSVCLDLFAGSGSLGIEAISNGAQICYFNDSNKEVVKFLKENLKGIDNYIISNKEYNKFLNETNEQFDIIFLDPPYKMNLINPSIDIIIKRNLLKENGLIICEYETEQIKCDLKLIKEKKYGSKKINIYKNELI